MRQIAYVSEDGQIRVRDLDVERDVEISHDESGLNEAWACGWPTWSPDGERLAYFRYEVANGKISGTSVCVAVADGQGDVQTVRPSSGGLIYMAWSPDCRRIAVLVQEGNRLLLRVIDTHGDGPPLTVAQGAPLYFTWLPDSLGLVVHLGMEGLVGPTSRIVWVRLESGTSTQTPLAAEPAVSFRAPCWSRVLLGATAALEENEGTRIILQTDATDPAETLCGAGPAPAFSWSPDGSTLAISSRRDSSGHDYGGLSVYAAASREQLRVIDNPILAFFWCPDSRRILYTTGEAGARMVRFRTLDIVSRETLDLGWLRPTRDLLLLQGHFDQYAQSAHLFSPAGDELVLAASRAKEAENGSVPTVRQLLIRMLGGDAAEQVIGRGRLAFWRPTAIL
ncbi:MAG: hypothetical protein HW416_980 [Chloroflexi bacterium]|nr:hypothetical protein [Chloroflexota bacterium]